MNKSKLNQQINMKDIPEPKLKITPDMLKSFEVITCTCGGKLFEQGMIFKKIPSLMSPSGREELTPLDVMVCKNCGKIPKEFNMYDMIPEELLAKEEESQSKLITK